MKIQNALRDICCYLDVTPWQLGILSSSKGLIAGFIKFTLQNNDQIDCTALLNTGLLIPLNITNIKIYNSNADYVLIVEKDTVFEKLLNGNIFNKNLILITGKGYPDINTRLMINKIWQKLHIPIYVLADADPFGIEIMLIYRYGSKVKYPSSLHTLIINS